MNSIARTGDRRSRYMARKIRRACEDGRRSARAGVLLLTGAPRVTDGVRTRPKPLAIPLFSFSDLDSLIDALSEPAGEADRQASTISYNSGPCGRR
ncbi:MAG: hypothetical protein A3G76_12760 [Acidobacteria bacterium RIFCSPLOWO2_12_FULL_65_11]|nr:MAG: hypothetical protein A3H95_12665 [Acidobacteria bacterium RIFCSPLOWO2_02_FULL_64_15]OFW29443.1 MAG: hypothetical protein A3G76_12760 [Acidobacteria bacterium RIFCSPLOWO2_12_FULL_65_11]